MIVLGVGSYLIVLIRSVLCCVNVVFGVLNSLL